LTPDIGSAEPPLNPTTADQTRKLDRSLMHGIAWTGALKWGTQLLSWAATLVIARLLTPGDYGILTMANVYLGFIALVNEFGLGPAIIRQRDLTDEQISALGGISIGLSFALWLLSAIVAFPIASFYGEPSVRWVIIALSFNFVTTGFRVLPRALMTRDLLFKRVAALDAAEAVTSTILTLSLALLGFRYWSLVCGGIAGSLVSTVIALRWRPHQRHWPKSLETVFPSLRFGWHIVVSRFAWYLYSSADFAVVGKLFGKIVLGGYGFAWTLASIPVTRVSALVNQITPGVFSASQHDQAQLKRYFLRLSEGLAFITFPFSIGVALVAREFVLVALGDQWEPAIVPLRLLAFYAGFRSITTLHPQVLQAVGRSKDQMGFSIIALVVLPPLFYLGGKLGGVGGVAWAWIIGYPLVMVQPYRAVFHATGLHVVEYLSALWPSILGSAGMAAVVLGVDNLLPPNLTSMHRLIVESSVGALTYVVLMFGLQRQRIHVLRALLTQLKM
jgi:PST family polysaccharide transporter